MYRLICCLSFLLLVSIEASAQATYLGKPLDYWATLIQDLDPKTQSDALKALKAFGRNSAPYLPKLMEMLNAPFEPVRVASQSPSIEILRPITSRQLIIEAIGAMGTSGEPARDAIIAWGSKEKHVLAVRSNWSASDLTALATLALGSEIAAIEALRAIGERQSIEALLPRVSDPEPKARYFALTCLRVYGYREPSFLAMAKTMAKNDADENVRSAAAQIK